MLVMGVRKMCVPVIQLLMVVHMGMGFITIPVEIVTMLVVRIVPMSVVMG